MTGSGLLGADEVANQRQIAQLTMDRLVSVRHLPAATPALTNVPMEIYIPGNAAQLATLQDLGGGRASHFGLAPYGTDIRDGDELIDDSGAEYLVHGVNRPYDMVICALSERRL